MRHHITHSHLKKNYKKKSIVVPRKMITFARKNQKKTLRIDTYRLSPREEKSMSGSRKKIIKINETQSTGLREGQGVLQYMREFKFRREKAGKAN